MKCLMRDGLRRAHAGGLCESRNQRPSMLPMNPIWTPPSGQHTLCIQMLAFHGCLQSDKAEQCRLTYSENRAVRRA